MHKTESMNTLYIVDLESIETRYTSQWKAHIPQLLHNPSKYVTRVIEGDSESVTTPGAFLNFADTNVYKSEQAIKIANLFSSGTVQKHDVFLFMDAWNTTALQVKYMSELLDIPVALIGVWHAGSYDPADILGQKIGNYGWVRHTEAALFSVYDQNIVATNFHKTLIENAYSFAKVYVTGFPFAYLSELITHTPWSEKENLIVFPHRLSPEKHPDKFDKLMEMLPGWKGIKCQEMSLTKHEYHSILKRAKFVVSFSSQETLGIAQYEGLLAGAIPLQPNDLSYAEIYNEMVLMPDRDPAKYAEKIREIASTSEHIVDMVLEKTREAASKHFDGALFKWYIENWMV